MMVALINAMIYDYQQYIHSGYIIFDDRIQDIGPMDKYKKRPDIKEVDCNHHLIIPSFVSGHTHLYSTFARGASLDFNPDNFMDILKQMWWKIDHFLDQDMIYYSALMGGIDQLRHGTTTLVDHHASGHIKDALSTIHQALVKDLNMRAILAFETSDRFDVDEAIKENIDFMSQDHKDAKGIFGMHASLSLSDDSLKKIAGALHGRGIHIHVAESLMDEEECVKKYGKRVVERLDDFGLINENALLVHCTHIDETEMKIIKERKATICINPTSNLNNGVGISHVRKMMDMGIRVIIGNDGLIQSQPMEYLNTYYLAHLKNKSPKAFSLDHIKQLIINAYAWVNEQLKTSLGSLKKGSQADLLVIPYQAYTPIDENNIFGHMFFGLFPGFTPKMVFVKGQLMIDGYHLVNVKEHLYQNALEQAKKLWNILEKEGHKVEFKN